MFSDVAWIEEAVEEFQELVRYLKNPELFDKTGIKPPRRVLLKGPPGCVKTLVAKAIDGEASVPFYQMAGSEFVEVLVGVGSARIRDLFKKAKVNKPSVIFINEIDALATSLLSWVPLIEWNYWILPFSVLVDLIIRILSPNSKGRLEILKVNARKVKLSDTVDLSTYANNLPGWTGAKLAQLLQEAALVAIRKGHAAILQPDMDNAVDRLTVGPKRVGIELSQQGQCRRATAEVGLL